MSRGRKIYHNKELHRKAVELRRAALAYLIMMIIVIIALALVFSYGDGEESSVLLVLGMAGLIAMFWFLFQTFQFRDFQVFENGILLPVHKATDYSPRRFVRFRDISVIEVSSGKRGMVVHYRDRRGREKSVRLVSMDVERDHDNLVEILKEKTAVSII
jgi:hypothetical protein